MTTYYLLPCHCGKKTEVDSGQAGLSVRCECGAELPVPTMRGLRQLEQAHAAGETRASASAGGAWGARQGVMFLGAVVFLAALLPGLYLAYSYPQRPQLFRTDFKEANAAEIERATLPETWELWKDLRQGFEQQGEHPQMQMYLIAEREARQRLIIVGVFGAIGLGLMIAGLFIRPAVAR